MHIYLYLYLNFPTRMEGSILSPALEALDHVISEEGKILTKPFLDVCKTVLPILDKFGGAFSFVKSDIGGNIARLETQYDSDSLEYKFLHSMIQKEVETKTERIQSSCTNSLLWLSRSMDYTVQLFKNLQEHKDWSMKHVCRDSYDKTFKKWHNWLASSTFNVGLKLVPDRKSFMEAIGTGDLSSDIVKFCDSFSLVLAENHKVLASVNMDNRKF
ncbi:glycolipid transfer protein 1-like [Vicia villosa]|uniref:glycolipid transfer protein 1-like n=1 Tax=Vicia villosa TaxID=3911 RepID=UPI00273C9300|nr:glycolipid transfer protein 1-like [Vicia villosa]